MVVARGAASRQLHVRGQELQALAQSTLMPSMLSRARSRGYVVQFGKIAQVFLLADGLAAQRSTMAI